MKPFYERNDWLLNDPVANPYFESVLNMNKQEFEDWCDYLRNRVTYIWDYYGVPPVTGKTEEEMLSLVNKIVEYPEHEILVKDELTGNKDTIYNTESQTSGVLNGFFPTMMKVRINYSKDETKGKSIYDFFSRPELRDRFITYARRHFQRDSFYHHSLPVKEWDRSDPDLCSESGIEWLLKFEELKRKYRTHAYWLQEVTGEEEYTGYNEKLKNEKYLTVTDDEILSVCCNFPWFRSDMNAFLGGDKKYRIRYYKLGERLFPMGFQAFRISYCQSPVNFPAITAKYLWKRYTDHIKDQKQIVLYDPSAGWGGRLLGALAINDRNIVYIGTDPNPDFNLKNGLTKYYEIAAFILNKSIRATELFGSGTSFQIFQDGSEVIQNNPNFLYWKGKVDMIFTSPPYFSKEKYSEDKNQSCVKFTTENDWKEGFLRPTLETCVQWLKENRYLLWNIAPVKYGKEWIPLDEWSAEILRELGMEYIETLKMSMAPMPGGNRLTEDEEGNTIGTTKNMVKINGNYRKYEPITVWKKVGI